MSFSVTLITVAMMLLYTIPGYLMMKAKLLKPESISAFATVLLYLCSPFQTLYAMQQIECSAYMVKYLAIALGLGLLLMGGMMGLLYAFTRKKQAAGQKVNEVQHTGRKIRGEFASRGTFWGGY